MVWGAFALAWCSRTIATVAKVKVNARRLMIIGVNRIPHGVKFRIRTTTGTKARLNPKLKAMRSIMSISVFKGKTAFMRL